MPRLGEMPVPCMCACGVLLCVLSGRACSCFQPYAAGHEVGDTVSYGIWMYGQCHSLISLLSSLVYVRCFIASFGGNMVTYLTSHQCCRSECCSGRSALCVETTVLTFVPNSMLLGMLFHRPLLLERLPAAHSISDVSEE